MTLFDLLYSMERLLNSMERGFLLSKKKFKIGSIVYYSMDYIPYYTLKKEVDNYTLCDNVIEILLKR